MSIYKNSIALLIMQGVNYLVPLVTLPYLTRVLGGYQYGVLSTALVFAQYTILIITFGFHLSATKKISEHQNDIIYISNIYWLTILSKIILFVISFFISLVIIQSVSQYHSILLIYLLCLPQIIGEVFFPAWLFQGVEKIKSISVMTIIPKLFVIPLLLLFVKDANNVSCAAFILALPTFFSAVLSLVEVKALGIKKINRVPLKDLIRYIGGSFHYFIGSVAISIYTLSTPIILSLVGTYQDVGYYSAADKLRVAMLGVFLVLGQAIYPRANFLLSNDINSYRCFIKKLIKYQLILCSLAAVIFYFIVPVFAMILLGSEFLHIGNILKIMSPMIVIVPASIILANCIMLPHGKIKAFAIIPWITAMLHIVYAYWLCKNYGAIGGSISILITELISFSILFLYCFKNNLFDQCFFYNK